MILRALNRFYISNISIILPFLIIGCGAQNNSEQKNTDNSETKSVMVPMSFNSGFALKNSNSDFISLTFLTTWSLNANILCVDAFGAGRNYSMNGITLNNSSSTLFLPANSTNCTFTVNSLNDGTSTYSPTGTKVSFAMNGTTQSMASASISRQYQDSGSNIIYINGFGSSGTATIDYATDSITSSTATNSILTTNMVFSVNQVTAATPPTFTLYTLQTDSSTYTDTLSANSAFPSTCKIIDSTKSGFLATTGWSNVNTDYGLTGSGVTDCSSVTLGSQGNWDSLKANDQYIIMATPASDGSINAYTVTKITAPAH